MNTSYCKSPSPVRSTNTHLCKGLYLLFNLDAGQVPEDMACCICTATMIVNTLLLCPRLQMNGRGQNMCRHACRPERWHRQA